MCAAQVQGPPSAGAEVKPLFTTKLMGVLVNFDARLKWMLVYIISDASYFVEQHWEHYLLCSPRNLCPCCVTQDIWGGVWPHQPFWVQITQSSTQLFVLTSHTKVRCVHHGKMGCPSVYAMHRFAFEVFWWIILRNFGHVHCPGPLDMSRSSGRPLKGLL